MNIHNNTMAGTIFFSLLGIISALYAGSVDAAVTTQELIGVVEVMQAGDQNWTALAGGIQIESGAQLRTGAQGGVELRCEDGSLVKVAQRSRVELSELFFSKSEKTRVFRFKLLQGGLTVNAVELDFTRFKVTAQAQETIRKQGMPDRLVRQLDSLLNKEFRDEKSYLNAVKKHIGGAAIIKYKYHLLTSADLRKNVFEINTDTLVAGILSSRGTITNSRVDSLAVSEGHFTVTQMVKGLTYISGLIDAKEGIKFPINQAGTWVRIGVKPDDDVITLESNAPLPQILALIGDSETVLKAKNYDDTPPFKVAYKENKAELNAGDAAYFGIPGEEVIPIIIETYANAEFQFLRQLPYFMFREERCPQCPPECCDYQHPVGPVPGPTPEIPAYTPPERPKQQTGSPIQP